MMVGSLSKDALTFRRVQSVFTDPSLLVKIKGRADEIMSEISEALKETSWGWKTEIRGDLYRYGDYEFSFNVGEMSWWLLMSLLDHPTDGPIKEVCIRVRLFMNKPDFRPFYVVFWPDKVRKSEIGLRTLILSVLRGLAYIACDAERYRDLILFVDYSDILAYHDRNRITRADVVMRRKNVPYDFVVSYHFDLHFEHGYNVPRVSTHFGIVARGKANFDVLAEAIMDEYGFFGGSGKE
jgi:hypothetical protein